MDAPEAGDEVGALDGDAIEIEVAEPGIGGGVGMVGHVAGQQPLIVGALDPSLHGGPLAGERHRASSVPSNRSETRGSRFRFRV